MSKTPGKDPLGIVHMSKAFIYSLYGLQSTWKNEKAFRVEVVLSCILFPTVLFLQLTSLEKAVMLACIMLVLIVELLNTAVENAIDRISDEIHPLAKAAKDAGSAAVMLAIVNLIVVWVFILVF